MQIIDAISCLDLLQSQRRHRLQELPRDKRGIYALADHEGNLKYIGMTASESESFYKRINQRHTTGSETYSHKYAGYYNVRRVWCGRKRGAATYDESLARRVRQALIRRHCRAAYVIVNASQFELASLEAEILRLAAPELREWNNVGAHFAIANEPEGLVDEVIRDLGLSAGEIAALNRQASLFARQTGTEL